MLYQLEALLPYLAIRPEWSNSPLFLSLGCPFTYQHFGSILNTLMSRLSYDSALYNTHSFCIGAAATARQANINTRLIYPDAGKIKKRSSNAYQARLSHKNLLAFKRIYTSQYQQTADVNS